MKLVAVLCFILLLTELCFSQCPDDQLWDLVSGKCVACGPQTDSMVDAITYCIELGGTFGTAHNQNLLEFAKTCLVPNQGPIEGVHTGLRVKLVDGQTVRFWNDGTPYVGPLPGTTFNDVELGNAEFFSGCYFHQHGTNVWKAEGCCCAGFFCARDPITTAAATTTNITVVTTTATSDSDDKVPLVVMSTVAVAALLALSGAVLLALRANARAAPALPRPLRLGRPVPPPLHL